MNCQTKKQKKMNNVLKRALSLIEANNLDLNLNNLKTTLGDIMEALNEADLFNSEESKNCLDILIKINTSERLFNSAMCHSKFNTEINFSDVDLDDIIFNFITDEYK